MKKENVTKYQLDNTPKSNYLWRGLGGNFDNLTQILNEFIDNSVSDFLKYSESEIKKVIIRVEEFKHGLYKIQVEDTGSGITNLNTAFEIGSKSNQSSSLNEHGFGLKHALAAANPDNDTWAIKTRTLEDKSNDSYHVIEAPFEIFNQEVIKYENSLEWGGLQPTGTIVSFEASEQLLKTITRGLPGAYGRLDSIMEVLGEDIGYTYGTFISNNTASITIRYKDYEMDTFDTIDISEVKPQYDDTIRPGIGMTTLDLGEGKVDLEYEFLKAIPSTYKKYYKATMTTSGVEIRLNGRLLASNLFSEIWGIEKHNSYNYILIRLNVKSDNPENLPVTTTNKSGLRQDDSKLSELYNWIKSKLPEPKSRASLADDEKDLFKQLEHLLKKTLGRYDDSLKVTGEMHAFTKVNEKVRIDLYQSYNGSTTIYRGKKNKTTPLDVYQLIMYWDGLVMDNIPVNKGILVASEHPESVKILVNLKKQSKDNNGKNYDLEIKTWQDLGIDYPN